MASPYTVPLESSADSNRSDAFPLPVPVPAEREDIATIPRLQVGLAINTLKEAGRFPCLSRFVAVLMGFDTCGVPMGRWQRIKHTFQSFVLYASMGLASWMLSRVVFGFSDVVAVSYGIAMTCNFMLFIVPMEQLNWGSRLLGHYVRARQKELMTAEHMSNMLGSALMPILFYVLPIGAIVLPTLASSDVNEQLSQGLQAGCWACLVAGIWITILFMGYGPLHSNVFENYFMYLTGDLIKDYADNFLNTLCDSTAGIDERRERLTALYERQGKHIKQALRQSANSSSVAQFPFMLVWMAMMVVWLVPDIVGGLPNREKALGSYAWLRITLSIMGMLWTAQALSFGLFKGMSKPSRLFEERLRSEISPHSSKLALAVQLFDGRSEELWRFVHAQGIWLSFFGICVDSTLPGKMAPLVTSILGAITWALVRQ